MDVTNLPLGQKLVFFTVLSKVSGACISNPGPVRSACLKQDLAKYKSMDTTQVEAALKASTYLAKWVD